ncbi:MAG: hypothetical protein K6E93_08795 [Bacteroidales bacterium]|nr:hypothetical protein [Bacteroidales bacterium]
MLKLAILKPVTFTLTLETRHLTLETKHLQPPTMKNKLFNMQLITPSEGAAGRLFQSWRRAVAQKYVILHPDIDRLASGCVAAVDGNT